MSTATSTLPLHLDSRSSVQVSHSKDPMRTDFIQDGTLIGIVAAPTGANRATNLCFGGADFKTIYITAGDAVYKLQGKIAGNVVIATPAPSASAPLSTPTSPIPSINSTKTGPAPSSTRPPASGTAEETLTYTEMP